jgi:thiol-disulfide isomerase/thioredoxin
LSERGPFGVHERPPGPGGEPVPPPPPPPPAAPVGRSTLSWTFGVVVLIILAYITFNSLRTEGPGSSGLSRGTLLPPFAMPLATSDLTGDANVATRPGGGTEGAEPACEVRGPDILNSCELAERGPVVLTFFAPPSELCQKQVDVLDRLRERFPDVGFAAVAIRGDRDDIRELIRKRRWGLPVGHDEDGAATNLYAAAICPTVTLAHQGGRVEATTLRMQADAGLSELVEKLRRR